MSDLDSATVRITPDSLDLFLGLAEDAANWSGTPPCWLTKEQRGNLTQLKKEGLLDTFFDGRDTFATFTKKGIAFATENGIDLNYIYTYGMMVADG